MENKYKYIIVDARMETFLSIKLHEFILVQKTSAIIIYN